MDGALETVSYTHLDVYKRQLWKWYIGMTLGLLGSILLMLIIPILGLLVALVTAIGTIVVSILKLVYLYRTAKVFREYRVPA